MISRSITTLLISTLAISMNISPANAAPKPGSPCKPVGQIVTFSGKKYTCVKKSGMLVWDNGLKSDSPDKGVTVDKNLFSVEVTIPASFYEGIKLTQKELTADAAKDGYGNVKLNKDGSVTYKMSKSQHQKVVAEMKKSVDDYIQETVNESPKIFRQITYNKDMTEFNVSVNQVAFENDIGAGMIGLGIGMLSAFYQMFSLGMANTKTVIKISDVKTGKVFDIQNYPEKK